LFSTNHHRRVHADNNLLPSLLPPLPPTPPPSSLTEQGSKQAQAFWCEATYHKRVDPQNEDGQQEEEVKETITLQRTAAHCNTLQHTAALDTTCCNTLQHSATLCSAFHRVGQQEKKINIRVTVLHIRTVSFSNMRRCKTK